MMESQIIYWDLVGKIIQSLREFAAWIEKCDEAKIANVHKFALFAQTSHACLIDAINLGSSF